ncbi:MAG: hypothetical protein SAK29_20890 [Scytonema sp. PMC 1069.18]|nr:hypothetical protein [Scytonema sp. PMC 1069.18]MEC4880967.1 hypothetical protein [Scytonema sp. PMC 1070.18]
MPNINKPAIVSPSFPVWRSRSQPPIERRNSWSTHGSYLTTDDD